MMKNTIHTLSILIGLLMTSSLVAQECPSNISCDQATRICGTTSASKYGCTNCGLDDETNLWYLAELPQTNTLITVSANGLGLDLLEIYGPLQDSYDCSESFLSQHLTYSNTAIANSHSTTVSATGKYLIKVSGEGCVNALRNVNLTFSNRPFCEEETKDETCESCVGSFAPIPGKNYLISAWASEENIQPSKTTLNQPQLLIHFTLQGGGIQTFGPFSPSGAVIDNWQRIEESFKVPLNAVSIEIELISNGDPVYFDDIRVLPFDASMKSFVYDPVNMRLDAELDERHYATFYEYDEEGKLIRIKKETEKGVMTIQETKSNSSK